MTDNITVQSAAMDAKYKGTVQAYTHVFNLRNSIEGCERISFVYCKSQFDLLSLCGLWISLDMSYNRSRCNMLYFHVNIRLIKTKHLNTNLNLPMELCTSKCCVGKLQYLWIKTSISYQVYWYYNCFNLWLWCNVFHCLVIVAQINLKHARMHVMC